MSAYNKPKKRGSLLPHGKQCSCGVYKGKLQTLKVRVNGHIHAAQVDLRDERGTRIGVFYLAEAFKTARRHSLDLVEINRTAELSICLLIDFGKFQYLVVNRKIPAKWKLLLK